MSTLEQELHNAVRGGQLPQIQSLLKKGAKIDGIYYGWTPLQQAIDVGNEDVAIFLIGEGCDINYHDNNHLAPFENAVRKNLAKVCEVFLKKGIDGNLALSDGETPLNVAVEKGSTKLVSVLVNEGKVDLSCKSKRGQSPLYVACSEGLTKIASMLVTSGADVNFVCDDDGQTSLIAAASSEHLDVVKLLLKYNADVNLQDTDGWTALWHAYTNSSEDIIELLLKAGADRNIPNSDGLTIMEDARENEDDEMLILFQKYLT
ncbi:putative ankyrin repeat protein RF_0381 [Haliotis rufescens]|uniref:putative ankyrin repeat protein RF_0381 n=1 Tax=Haliotis rufescens TaxID=6454 RepID=UPI001EAFC543|nr:putative ankyrin repeat protein RF_0381 [Haliotis rufescens]